MITWYWNLVHYSIFKFENLASDLIRKPISWLMQPLFKIVNRKRSQEQSISYQEIANMREKVIKNPETGVNSIRAGIHAGGLLVLLEFTFLNFLQALIGKWFSPLILENSSYRYAFLIFLIIPPGIFNYFI